MASWTRQIQTPDLTNKTVLFTSRPTYCYWDVVIEITEFVLSQLVIDFLFGYLPSSVKKLCML